MLKTGLEIEFGDRTAPESTVKVGALSVDLPRLEYDKGSWHHHQLRQAIATCFEHMYVLPRLSGTHTYAQLG